MLFSCVSIWVNLWYIVLTRMTLRSSYSFLKMRLNCWTLVAVGQWLWFFTLAMMNPKYLRMSPVLVMNSHPNNFFLNKDVDSFQDMHHANGPPVGHPDANGQYVFCCIFASLVHENIDFHVWLPFTRWKGMIWCNVRVWFVSNCFGKRDNKKYSWFRHSTILVDMWSVFLHLSS